MDYSNVAPRAGAWIETTIKQYRPGEQIDVAPRAGAWIETEEGCSALSPFSSPLAQGRGLKRHMGFVVGVSPGRPSRRGVD